MFVGRYVPKNNQRFILLKCGTGRFSIAFQSVKWCRKNRRRKTRYIFMKLISLFYKGVGNTLSKLAIKPQRIFFENNILYNAIYINYNLFKE